MSEIDETTGMYIDTEQDLAHANAEQDHVVSAGYWDGTQGVQAHDHSGGEQSESEGEDADTFASGQSHHPDGSRAWRFKPQADPRSWGDLGWIDQNMAEVTRLGWIEANPAGNHWTIEDATAAHEAWRVEAIAPYQMVDDGSDAAADPGFDVSGSPVASAQDLAASGSPAPGTQMQGPPAAAADSQPPPPPPAPAVPGPAWGRGEDPVPGGTQYSDVMAELRAAVPENQGRWSATQAAQFDNDSAFLDETGITAAQRQAEQAGDALAQESSTGDGTISAATMGAALDAQAEYQRRTTEADSSRNRYQQSTDFQPPMSADEVNAQIDAGLEEQRRMLADDPASMGVGLSTDHQAARAEAQEYASWTGEQVDLSQPLSAEQRQRLGELRQQGEAEAAARQREWESSPEGRQAMADDARRSAQAMGEQDRVAASRARVDEIMETPIDRR